MKTYVLDTSALIFDPCAWKQFPNSVCILPIVVLNELDKLKKQAGDAGRNARVCIRQLDEISDKLDISTGILLEDGVMLKIDVTYRDMKEPDFAGFGDPSYGDTQILACALSHWQDHPEHDVTLVSNDINLRVKAKSRSIDAIAHEDKNKEANGLYMGAKVINDEDAGIDLLKAGSIDPRLYGLDLNMNECVLFEASDGSGGISMGRKTAVDRLKLIRKVYPWNIASRNKEQAFAMDILMDKNVDLVTLIGKAGTGKSLCALAVAMELVLQKKEYDRLVIYRPIQSVGSEIGFLPGPQPLDAKILTPDGWTTMGELDIGSLVISRDGKPTKVIGVYPKGKKSVYKVTTTDGTSTECCEDHLWYTQTAENKKRNKLGSVKSTKEMINSLYMNDKLNHFLPRNNAVHFNERELPIKPYALGAILGDGSCSNTISITNTDLELINRFNSEISELNCTLHYNKNESYHISSNLFNNKPARVVRITNIKTGEVTNYNSIGIANKSININKSTLHNRCENKLTIGDIHYEFIKCEVRWANPIKEIINNLGLSGRKAWDKFIPDLYKYNSIENRIDLLRGLMDTDGSIKNNGEASYCTTSKRLALDVIELVRSLGGRATLLSRDRVGKRGAVISGREIIPRRVSYEFTISLPKDINPFYISRKSNKHSKKYIHRVGIKSIECIGEKEVQCIRVDNPEHLYITDDFIVTHNTKEEKLEPWFQAIMDSFEVLFGNKSSSDWKRDLEMFKKKGKIEMEAIAYIRGRSIPNAIMLIDEAQNISKEDIKTILTRAGEGTKIILTGDLDQIDSKDLDASNNGLTHVVEAFKDSEMAGHITFVQGERSKLATKASEIL